MHFDSRLKLLKSVLGFYLTLSKFLMDDTEDVK